MFVRLAAGAFPSYSQRYLASDIVHHAAMSQLAAVSRSARPAALVIEKPRTSPAGAERPR